MSIAVTAQQPLPAEPRTAAGSAAAHVAADAGTAAWLALGVLLPLSIFSLLAVAVGQGPLPFDLPLLGFAHASGGTRFDGFWLLVTRFGHEWGVVPVDIGLVALLLLARRWRSALFAAIALGGSGLLNVASKLAFSRLRPELWDSIAPEHNFSFPSGHAMGSMTLAWVLLLLAWPTRWRWPVAVAMGVFVACVGWSRIHLGVHYPSDILAGWAAATAWTVAAWLATGHGRAARA